MKDADKRLVPNILVIMGLVILLLLLAYLMPVCLRDFKHDFNLNNGVDDSLGQFDSNWLSFFGSYLGGLLGGLATLIAVVFTIQSNKNEQDRKERTEKKKEIQKSALVVYLDFRFAFDNIRAFLFQFWSLKKKQGDKNPYKELVVNSKNNGNNNCKSDTDIYKECLVKLDQFYYDQEFVRSVAKLNDPVLLGNEMIRQIAGIYGDISNIYKSIEASDKKEDVYKMAFKSMNNLVEVKKDPLSDEFSLADVVVKAYPKSILNTLENIAFDYDREISSVKKVKIILDDLCDRLMSLIIEHKEKKGIKEETVYIALNEVAQKHKFGFPEREGHELKEEIWNELIKKFNNPYYADRDKGKKLLKRDIMPILRKNDYLPVSSEVFNEVYEDCKSQANGLDS